MLIRMEGADDYPGVYKVNAAAFTTTAEAELVEVLRKDAKPIISLVAEDEGVITGHILFTPVRLEGREELKIMGLGPMAVLPGWQGKGIGSALVREGLEKCKEIGYGSVVVLGHTWFYPKFGFRPSVLYAIRCEYDVPEEAFMVLETRPGYLEGGEGTIRYHPAFKDV